MQASEISEALNLRQRIAAVFSVCALVSALVLWAVWGNIATYLALAVALPAALLNWRKQDWVALLTAPWIWALWGGFALMSLSFLLQPGQASVPYIGDFLFFALSPVIAAAIAPACRSWLTPTLLCIAFLCVTALTAAVGLVGLAAGNARASAMDLSPIHFADLAIIFGFLGLGLVLIADQFWRSIALVGPLLAVIAAGASGTRAAVLVGGILALLFGAFVIRRMQAAPWVKLTVPLLLFAVMMLAFYLANLMGFNRPWDAILVIGRLLTGDIWSDASSAYRVEMFYGGWQAFLDAPLFGHGWHTQLQAAMPYFSERGLEGYAAESWGYIHNDALSFAVAAGVPGFLAYCLFLAAPLLALWGSPVSDARLYLALTLSIGLLASGMTDVLFMVETPKVLLIFVAATLFFLGRPSHR